jgi:hypothetical protein
VRLQTKKGNYDANKKSIKMAVNQCNKSYDYCPFFIGSE